MDLIEICNRFSDLNVELKEHPQWMIYQPLKW